MQVNPFMAQPTLLGKVGCSVSFRGIPPDLDSYGFTPKSLPSTPPTCHSLFMRGNRREFPFSQRLGEKATSAHLSCDGNVGGAYTVALWRLSEKYRYRPPGKTASLRQRRPI